MAWRADCYWRGLPVTGNVERSAIRVAIGCSCSLKRMTPPATTLPSVHERGRGGERRFAYIGVEVRPGTAVLAALMADMPTLSTTEA